MIDLKDLKQKIHESDRYRGSDIDSILKEYPDYITETEYISIVPILLRLGKLQELIA